MNLLFVFLSNNSSGFEKLVVGGICGGLFAIIMYAINATKEKIDETKLKNNPNDINLLTISANKDIENNNIDSAVIKFKKIVEIDNSNLYAQLVLGIIFYKNKEYNKSKDYLLPVLTTKVERDNVTLKDFFINYSDEIGYACYSIGHIYHLEGDFDNAADYKEKAINIDKKWSKSSIY